MTAAEWDPLTESFDVERAVEPSEPDTYDPETQPGDAERCWHTDTRVEEEVGTGRLFTVCEGCNADVTNLPADPY